MILATSIAGYRTRRHDHTHKFSLLRNMKIVSRTTITSKNTAHMVATIFNIKGNDAFNKDIKKIEVRGSYGLRVCMLR